MARNDQNTPTGPRSSVLPWALLAGFVGLSCPAYVHAQSDTPAKAPPATATTSDSDEDEEVVQLSPFVVDTTSETDSYTAHDTLAGSRVRTELKDLPSAISVVTSQFLKDTGAKNSQDLLVYTTNTEVGGVRGNFSGAGNGSAYNEAANLLRPNQNTRVRGLDQADNTRDFFLTEIPWDSYNVDRVDMQRGPNSILFGLGSPAGIINAGLNQARYKNSFKYENRIGSFGSFRNSLDFNYVVIPDELAIRVDALRDDTRYQQEPAYNRDQRLYAAIRYEPKLFGEGSRTSIRANFESGDVSANRPRALPPIDGITTWFLTGGVPYPGDSTKADIPNLNKLTLNPVTTWNQYGNNSAIYPNYVYPWLGTMGRFFSNDIATFYNAGSSTPITVRTPNIGTPLGLDSSGNVDGTIAAIEFSRPYGINTFSNYARQVLPGGKFYKNYSLSDPSIFDFYNKLMDGDNKHEYQKWTAANIGLVQSFFNDKLAFELVYDMQRYRDGQYAFLAGDQYELSVDINSYYVDGTPNPNVGRPFVANSGQYGSSENYIDRDVLRFTTTADIRSEDFLGKGLLSEILGRHVFTGLAVRDVKNTDYRGFSRWASSLGYAETVANSLQGSDDITNGARQIDWVAYLGPSLLNATSAAGANLSAVTANLSPASQETVRYFDSHWNRPTDPSATGYVDPAATYVYYTHDTNGNLVTNTGTQADNPANYVGWTTGTFDILNSQKGDIASLYTSGQKSKLSIDSVGLTWQAYLFGGNLVPIYGWRRDTVKNASSFAPKDSHDVSLMNYRVDTSDANTLKLSKDSRSWGVVLHTPQKFRDMLPQHTYVSLFYNNSENFKADAPRGDVFGNQIPNPYAHTEDYGVVLSTLEDRLSLKITWYKTKDQNATLYDDTAGFSSNLYYAWALPYWEATHALAALDGISSPQLRQGGWGWPWNGIATNDNGTPNDTSDDTPDTVRIRQIVEDFFKNFPLDQHFADEYGLGLDVAAMRAATTDAQRYASVPTYGLTNGVYDPVGGAGASGLGLQPAYAGNLRDFGSGPKASVDTTSKGIELELNAKPIPEWNISVNVSKTTAAYSAVSPTIQKWIDTYTNFLAGDAGLVRLWGGDTFRKVWADNILAPYSVLQAEIGNSAPEIAPWRFNVVTNYSFFEGPVKGLNVGAGYRWEDKRILGYEYDATNDSLDIHKPLYGDTDDHYDAWVGYETNLTEKIKWRIQLNVRNLFESPHLVPVTKQPDGTVALSRIEDGTTWQLTNTFSF